MTPLTADLMARIDTPERRKFIRYSLVSVVSVLITVTVQTLCYGIFRIDPGWSAVIASSTAAFPSYYLNRAWVWKKNGRSHLTKEVIPFWVMAAIGLAVSTAASEFADTLGRSITDNHALKTVIVSGASVTAFGILWVVKFIIFNKILFAHREDELEPALDGRAGLPT